MLRFNFDAQAGETPASIAQKRALVAQIMGSARAPQTVGEGFSAIGDGIVANVLAGRADDAQRAGQSSADDTFSRLVASITGQGAGIPQTASDAAGAMANTATPSSQAVSFGGDQQSFIDTVMPGAIEASRRTGIDPRIIVAQAAQESGWGQHAPGNNLFGIKSHGQSGGQDLWTTEEVNGQSVRVRDNFRTYASPADSISGYADFLLQNPRYKPFMGAQGLDAQLEELGRSGYATDSNYANSVGSIARSITLPEGFAGGGAPTQVAQGPDLAMLMEASANPWLSDIQKSVINSMIAQQMQQMDPAYQQGLRAADLGIQKAEIELEQLRNKPPPLPGAPKTEKIYDPETGREKIVQWNEHAGAWEDLGGVSAPKDPLVQVNTGDALPGLGKLSTDYAYLTDPTTGMPIIDPETNLPTSAPVPGSPAAIAAEQAAAAQAAQEGAQISSDIEGAEKTLVSTRNVLDILDNTEGQPTTGTLSRPFALLSNTPAGRIRSYVSTLQSGVALGAMQRLKEASSTGATGFGALSAPELNLLISDIGALDPDNTEPDIFRETVQRIEDRAKRVVADIRKNVAPERIQELGLQGFLDAFDPPAANQSTPGDIDEILKGYGL